jgi:hypothetical protein
MLFMLAPCWADDNPGKIKFRDRLVRELILPYLGKYDERNDEKEQLMISGTRKG